MKFSKASSGYIVLTVSAFCILFLAAIWVSYARQRSFDRKDAVQFAVEKNSNLAVALEQYAIRTLHNADAVLQIVKMEYALKGDSVDLQNLLKRNALSDMIAGVAIIGADGRLKKSNIPLPEGTIPDFSDRYYFDFHSRNNKDSLLISKPMVSKSISKPVIIISRRLNDARGHFGGIVALQIEPSTFTSFYAQAKLLPHDIISLISPDGITYARRTGAVESSGEDIQKSPLFVNVLRAPDSFYFARDAIKGIPTWFSYRKLKEYPIIATVGSSEQDILSSYSETQPRYLTPRVITSVSMVLFSFLLAVFLLHRRRLTERLRKEEERYQQLLTEQVIAVQEREREWIGRELHDNVNQVLTTVKLYLETASGGASDPLIPRSMQLVNSTISEIRNLSHQLSAPTLGTRSLVDSINALIEMVSVSTELRFQFESEGYLQGLAMNHQLALYRILQEQLNNIIKHSGATRVWINLTREDDQVVLIVRDNGRGFDANAKTNGMGLNSMVSRARVLGGTVEIETGARKGCFVKVIVPVEKAGEDLVA